MSKRVWLAVTKECTRSVACPFKLTWMPQIPNGRQSPSLTSQDPALLPGGLHCSLHILQKDYRGFCEVLVLPVAVQTCLCAGVQHRVLENGSLRSPHPSHSPLKVATCWAPRKVQSPSLIITNPLQTESCSFVSEPISGWVEQKVLATGSTGARSQGPGDPDLLDKVPIIVIKHCGQNNLGRSLSGLHFYTTAHH